MLEDAIDRIADDDYIVKLEQQNKRYREALNHIQSEVMKVCPNDLLFEIYDATRKGLGEV